MFEQYIKEFPDKLLPTVLSREQVDTFLSAQSVDKQRELFKQWPLDKFKEVF